MLASVAHVLRFAKFFDPPCVERNPRWNADAYGGNGVESTYAEQKCRWNAVTVSAALSDEILSARRRRLSRARASSL